MPINLFVIDDAKCLHDLLEVLSEQSVVAPTNHADTTNKYGAGTTTKYGHLMLTNEGNVPTSWSTPPTGKAVSGTDGYLIVERIKQNETDISSLQGAVLSLQEAVKVPVGSTIISEAPSETALPQYGYDYGTWVLIKTDSVTVGSETYYMNYYYRTA